jgi:AcrR family transcriptional regulator
VARPRTRDYSELRLDLVDVAGRLLTSEGPAALSTRRVAQEVGVSTTAVYSLFGDKAGLVRAMFLAGFDRLTAAFDALPVTANPVVDLLALGEAYRANALANPHLYDLMFGRPIPEFQPTPDDLAQIQPSMDTLVRTVTRCLDSGAFAESDPEAIAVHLNALVHGLCSLELRGALGPKERADELWTAALGATMRGYAAASSNGRTFLKRRSEVSSDRVRPQGTVGGT